MHGNAAEGTVGKVNHDGNRPVVAEANDLTILAPEHAEAVRQLWSGSLGRTVRCVPSRRTLQASDRGRLLYAKRYDTARGADAEWRGLRQLADAGFDVPARVAHLEAPGASMAVYAAVPGRSLDAWAVDAVREGWLQAWIDYVVAAVAPLARRLHERGWVHRDLNLSHLFAVDPRRPEPPALIDVERVFRPRWRRSRWRVKDLASLLASCPGDVPGRAKGRFLLRYADGRRRSEVRALGRAVEAKAARIQRHTPRFG